MLSGDGPYKANTLAKGIIIPSITVFKQDEDQTLDEHRTGDHVDWLISNGADAIVPAGSSGEFPALRMDEAKQIFDIAISVAKKRVPVYPAVGRYGTRDTIELTRHAEKAGAAGVMVIVPYYMKPDRHAIMEHFRAVRRNTDLPIILYNNPATTGVELAHDDIVSLFDEGVVNGVKSSQGEVEPTIKLTSARAKLCSYYGHDIQPTMALNEGAYGWFSLFPNVFPRLAKQLQSGTSHEQKDVWMRLAPCVNFVWGGTAHPVAAVKAALEIQGRWVGVPRLPLQPLPQYVYQRLETIVREAGAA
ncbi:MAG: dihydrodipicolinate synthase family protein [Patescibacteria group bacterium]|jgi:4-hydroxy-tetrahydrodipicolinate synthase